MHDFHAGTRTPGRPQRLEPECRPREPCHGAMVLFYDIIQIF
jgi:hypothetical protein